MITLFCHVKLPEIARKKIAIFSLRSRVFNTVYRTLINCLEFGDSYLIDYINPEVAMYKACKWGRVKSAHMLAKHITEWNWALIGACKSTNEYLINYALQNGAVCTPLSISAICRTGHYELAVKLFNMSTMCVNFALENSCRSGNIELVNYFIERGANDWNWALCASCTAGNEKLVDLFLEKGATLYKTAYERAISSGHDEIALKLLKLIIKKN